MTTMPVSAYWYKLSNLVVYAKEAGCAVSSQLANAISAKNIDAVTKHLSSEPAETAYIQIMADTANLIKTA